MYAELTVLGDEHVDGTADPADPSGLGGRQGLWPPLTPDELDGGVEDLPRFLVAPWTSPAARRAIGYKAIEAVGPRLSVIRIDPLPLSGAGKHLGWLCFGPQAEIDAWHTEGPHAWAITSAVERWLAGDFLSFASALASTYPLDEVVDAILPCLDERQRNVLTWRAAGETLEAVATIYGVTRERVRQVDIQARERLAERIIGLRAFRHPAASVLLCNLERASKLVFAAACQEEGKLSEDTRDAWAKRVLPARQAELLQMFRLVADGALDELRHLFDPISEMGHPFQGGRSDLPWTDADVTLLAAAFASVVGERRRRWAGIGELCAASGLPPYAVKRLANFARMTVHGDSVFEGRLRVKDIRRMTIATVLEQANRPLHEAEIVQSLIPVGFETSAPLREVHDALAGDPETFASDGRALWQLRRLLGDAVEDRRPEHPDLPPPWPADIILDRLTEPGCWTVADRTAALGDLSTDDPSFLFSAGKRLGNALTKLRATERKSVGQVLTTSDETKLLAWLDASCGSEQAERDTGSSSSERALEGLTALAAFTAVVRADCGSDDAHWSAIRERCGSDLRSRWFDSQGVPQVRLRSALVDAVAKFQLRETFSFVSDPWSTLITLQAGLLRGDMDVLGPALSSGRPTVALRHFVAPGPNHSASAALLWNVLVQFRRGNLGRSEVEAVASQSEWWPGWSVDEACRACLEKAQDYRPAPSQSQSVLPSVYPPYPATEPPAPVSGQTDLDAQPVPVSAQRVGWRDPEVLLAQDGGSFLLQLPRFLSVGSGPIALVGSGVREGGRVQESGEVEWHGHRPHIRVELRGACERQFHIERGGEDLETHTVRLWAPDDYLVAYPIASGPARSLDPYLRAVPRTGRVALLLHRSLQISVTADEEHPLDDTYVLKVFGSGIPTGTTVSCDGEVLWAAEPQAESRRILDDNNAELVLDNTGATLGGRADLVLADCPEGFEPQRAIVGSQTLFPSFDGTTWRFPNFLLLPGMDTLRRRGRLDGLVRGERVSLAAHVLIAHAPHGVALRTDSGWRPIVQTAPFLCGHQGTGLLWASLPKMVDDPDWTVFEGARPVLAYRESGIRLDRKLLGFGEPLTIEQRQFNRTSGTTRVSDLVLNNGIVSGGESRGDLLVIRTATPVRWTERHRAVGVCTNGIRDLDPLPSGGDASELRFAAGEDVEIVCLLHSDIWLGTAYLTDDIEGAILPLVQTADGWKETITFALKAWLPILTPKTRARITARMQVDGGAGLFALCHLPIDQFTTHLTGELLAQWQPGRKLAEALVDMFLQKLEKGDRQRVTALERITTSAPCGAVRAIALGLGSRPQRDRIRAIVTLSQGLLPKEIQEGGQPSAATTLSQVEEELLARAMESTGFDFNFLASKSGASIASLAWAAVASPGQHEPNLDTCMTIAPIRRWIAAHLLTRLSAILR